MTRYRIRVDMQSNVHRNTLIPLRLDERTVLQDSNGQEMVITLRLTQRDDLPQNVPKNDCTKWFDCDRMYADVLADPTEKEADRGHFDRDNGPVWRFPQEGDYLQLTGAGGTNTGAYLYRC